MVCSSGEVSTLLMRESESFQNTADVHYDKHPLRIVFVLFFRLEDGTLPFLDILALRHGFATLTRLGRSMEAIQQHTFSLAR